MAMTIAIAIATILTATLPLEAVAQFDCRNDIADLSSCFGYIQGRDFFPSPDCCNRLEDVVDQRPDCLCEVVRGNGGGVINQTRFLLLPSACGVRTPSVANCYYGSKKLTNTSL
ncbi:non-specific lipid transfer protein GPI-anchored 1 [Phtheirospermum japonicum]|uniref:Non-specific lipid transfer protein GPI-anchored 1 n=1 Tax=Phtheirospermum japonicum TaxID=374723 RepID=A0A830BB23_9LAMI|nr:non-specific lipid transfer protein GPI-anchored 1 [Phtheirospermum japonicum]